MQLDVIVFELLRDTDVVIAQTYEDEDRSADPNEFAVVGPCAFRVWARHSDPQDAATLIESFSSVLRGAAGESIELHYVCECDEDRRDIDVDATQFKAALLNLVVNAREAMPDGGRVVIACALVDIDRDDPRCPQLSGGRYVTVAVSDAGAGIPRDSLEHVFEPFYTSKDAATPGSGLGLCQISGFAAQSGGGVGIVTELGRGTCVTIYLPLKAHAKDSADESRAAAGAPRTVLLVEDDEHVRRSTFHALELLGYRVLEEANGPDALARLRREREVDILFTDVVMPRGMTGAALAREARALRPQLAILLSSGHRREATGAEPLDDFAFLAKPYELKDLALALRAIERRNV